MARTVMMVVMTPRILPGHHQVTLLVEDLFLLMLLMFRVRTDPCCDIFYYFTVQYSIVFEGRLVRCAAFYL